MWAFLHKYSRWPQSLKAVEAEKCVALHTFVWVRRNRVANYALQKIGADLDRLIAITIELDLGAWQPR